MQETEKVSPWTARFTSRETEAAYLDFVFRGNINNNFRSLFILFPLYAAYSIIDLTTLQNPIEGAAIRLSAASTCIVAFALMKVRALERHHEYILSVMLLILGSAISLIIAREPGLANSYYVGLIQGGVITCFLFRIEFIKTFVSMLLIIAGFGWALLQDKPAQEAALQFVIITTMYALCLFGIYFLQRFRRTDFLKTRLIAEQNEQLNAMLAEARIDNARKVAAMNLLVHFVRTPIHQIVGFTDVLTSSLDADGREQAPKDCIESAGFIRSASRELFKNVSQLLVYYRLDEKASAPAAEIVELHGLIEDFSEELPSSIKTHRRLDRVAIVTRREIVVDAVKSLCTYYAEAPNPPQRLDFRLERVGDHACITISDDLPLLGDQEFERQTRPLDKLDHYLTANGTSMPMALRTAARASELAGGALQWRAQNGRNLFALTLRDYAASARVEPAAAA